MPSAADAAPGAPRRYLAEFLGTFVLVAIGPGAAMVAARTHAIDQQGVALAFGLAVALIVASSGPISGAHINPAVTIAFWSLGRFAPLDALCYVAAQCAGAVAASATLGWILGPVGSFGATTPGLPLAQSFVVEMGFTAVLGFVIASVRRVQTSPVLPAFAVGATVWAGALVAGPLTGGSFNPARSLGPAVVGGIWTAHWLYWCAPILGMIVGMRLFRATARDV